MSNHRFLQIHSLTSYSATLLNRDDVGFSKRIPFGGATRTRISSQCLKRHWRTSDGEHALAGLGGDVAKASVRSRLTFERYVREPLEKEGFPAPVAKAVTEAIMSAVLGKSAKAEKAEEEAKEEAKDEEEADVSAKPANAKKVKDKPKDGERVPLQTKQVTIFGRPEIDLFLAEARAICKRTSSAEEAKKMTEARFGKDKEFKENVKALKHSAGLDAALFGRMVTSDILSRGDAAIHVAHAFTVHAEAAESDYFSAVDDLLASGDDAQLGSGHIGSTELTSGLFYGYVVVDLPLLVKNLEDDRALAARVVSNLIHLVATVSPGAKLGSTAPYAYADAVLVEAGNSQPRTLANSFLAPVRERPDVLKNTYEALGTYLGEIDKMYGGSTENRRLTARGPHQLLDKIAPAPAKIADVATWAATHTGT